MKEKSKRIDEVKYPMIDELDKKIGKLIHDYIFDMTEEQRMAFTDEFLLNCRGNVVYDRSVADSISFALILVNLKKKAKEGEK